MAASSALAQTLAPAFRAYPLEHAAAAEVAEQLSRLLDVLPDASDVIVDVASNRLLVSGGDAAQNLALQLIETLDQPQSTAGGPPELQSYRVEPARLETVAAQLRAEFGQHPHVRIAADARTAQLLVVAPAVVQQQVAARLQAAPATHGTLHTSNIPAPASPSVPHDSIVLAHATCSQVQAMLSRAFVGQFSTTAVAGQPQSSSVLSLGDGAVVRLDADDRNNTIQLSGPRETKAICAQLIAAIDRAHRDASARRLIVPLQRTAPQQARRAVEVFSLASQTAPRATLPNSAATARRQAIPLENVPFLARMFQPEEGGNQTEGQQQPADNGGNQPGNEQPSPAEVVVAPGDLGTGLVGPVQIEFLEGLDVMIVSGNDRDVERVLRIIEDIERLSTETEPVIEVVQLQHTGSEQLAEVARQVYDEVLASRQGQVSITALVKPNALLVIGRAESVKAVTELVTRLDQPVDPGTQFAVFRLKHMPATAAQTTVEEFFEEREGLGTQVRVTADFRTNSLVVHGSPRDLTEVGELLTRLDSATSDAVNQVRVIPLRNSLATELAPLLQYAISAQATGGAGAQGVQQVLPTQQPGGAGQGAQSPISSMLELLTIDPEGQQRLTSGILTDVRITADARANALVISAPADSMELIVALVRQLDEIPATTAQIKVFTIVKGDAASLVEMLRSLFGQATAGGGGFTQQGGAVVAGENPLVPLRFSVDQRTNSIIAQGSANDLNIVEAILLRLDASDVEERRNTVYRLKNSYALDVANAINEFLQSQRDLQQAQEGLLSPFEQLEREVVVVPEIVSNSLIVSATPRYFEEIAELVEDLDERPPMVVIQVLIAEVALNNTDEFGVELGLQDSVLFDRSLLADLVTTTNSTQTNLGGAVVTNTQEVIQGATLTPGYIFNQAAIPNSGSDTSRANSQSVGGQGLTNFALGRINGELGYGGLVLSAYSESVSLLIRALQESRRLDVLSRPQVTTLDNQPAFIQVGARVPRVQGVTLNETGQVNNVTDVNVGLILAVTPRISPDGLVVMEVDAEKSALGPEEEGVPISISATGEVVRQPLINTTTAQTTVSALSGQTIILGGLITKTVSVTSRRVPLLSDIPVLGNLFRYDAEAQQRTELLIILTPKIVRNQDDMEFIKQEEAARMHWCLSDVVNIHGEAGLNHRAGHWDDSETIVIYPDVDPTGAQLLPPAEVLDAIPPPDQAPTEMPPPPVLPQQSGAQPMNATPAPPQVNPPQLQLKTAE